jgi:prepilin-type N-terminal cleavage/methylation domain-containing protein/prepilin-type processing-associated H-X9-DG protein
MKVIKQQSRIMTNGLQHIHRRSPADSAGFSLIELLVVLALMIVITTMMWGFGSESRQHAAQRDCRQNLEKVYLALQIYANDFSGRLPASTNAQTSEDPLSLLVPRYSADTSIFICLGGRDPGLPSGVSFANRKISYAYYMGQKLGDVQQPLMSDRQVNTLSKQAGEQVFSTNGKPPGNNHHKYGGNFLFGDGHADLTPPQLAFSLVTTQGVVLLNPKP